MATNPDPEAGPDHSSEPGTNHIVINAEFFGSKQVRLNFIRKVYSLLTVQLLITISIVALFTLHHPLKAWGMDNPAFLLGSFGFGFITLLVVNCFEDLRRKHPINLIILFVFTIAESLAIAAISIQFETKTVLLAAIITLSVTLALTAFAMQTSYDFTAKLGILIVVLIVAIFVMTIGIFFPKTFEPFALIMTGFMAILMGIFIVVDTQMIVGGTHSIQRSPEEYVSATISLYLDIINLFIYILSLLGRR